MVSSPPGPPVPGPTRIDVTIDHKLPARHWFGSVTAIAKVTAWPLIVLVALLLFRVPIAGVIESLKSRSFGYKDIWFGERRASLTTLAADRTSETPHDAPATTNAAIHSLQALNELTPPSERPVPASEGWSFVGAYKGPGHWERPSFTFPPVKTPDQLVGERLEVRNPTYLRRGSPTEDYRLDTIERVLQVGEHVRVKEMKQILYKDADRVWARISVDRKEAQSRD